MISLEIKNDIRLSYDEYVLLMELLGAKDIHGTFITDNYMNITSDSIEKIWASCQKTLTDKGYITIKNDAVDFNIALYYILKQCIDSEKVFNVQMAKNGKSMLDTLYYINNGVPFSVKNDNSNKEVIISIRSKKSVCATLKKHIDDMNFNTDSFANAQIELNEHDYISVLANINVGNVKKVKSLLPDNLSQDDIESLTASISAGAFNISITEYLDDADSIYTFISDGKNIWSVYSDDEKDVIVFEKINPSDISSLFDKLFGNNGGIQNE